jgi:hypothetical protein
MATAQKKIVTVKKVEEVEEEAVTLELSLDEAQLLRDLLGMHVIGPFEGRRALGHRIFETLADAGVER